MLAKGWAVDDHLAISPTSILKRAIKAVPAVKYALGVGGIIAVIAIIRTSFKIDWRVAVFGAVVMLILMTVLVIFASIVGKKKSVSRTPAKVLTWFCLVIFMATSCALFSSVFFGWPLDLRLIIPVSAHEKPPVGDTAERLAEKAEEQGDLNASHGISDEYCYWHTICPQVQSPFLPPKVIDDWNAAKFYWKQSLGLTKDDIRKVRLAAKLSIENSVRCKLNEKEGHATCDPIPKGGDLLDSESQKIGQLRPPFITF